VSDWYDDSLEGIDAADETDEDREQFDWDDGNLDHLRRSISPEEVEEAVCDPRRRSARAYGVEGERRWALVGATEDERILFVVYTYRSGRIRPISARDATSMERRQYRR
jgi:uncharacterized protein